MTDEEFAEVLRLGYELPGVEFKGPGPRTNATLFLRVTRAALALANRRDGGYIVIGVDNNGHVLTPVGLTQADLATWNYDDISAGIAAYADPYVRFDLEIKENGGNRYVVLTVREFEEIPVLCKRDSTGVLRAGACYVRTRRKPESAEIPSQTEMRELLDLAIEKGLRKYFRMRSVEAEAAGPTDAGRFEAQRRRRA